MVCVAHVIYGLQLGGLEQLVVQLAARSQARGIRTSIVALGPDGPVRDLALAQGIPVERPRGKGLSVPALLGIRRALEKIRATVVHAHDLGPWLNAVAVRMLRPRTRVIATFHEQREPRGRQRRAAGIAARFSDVLVACGEQVRDEIQRWAPWGACVPVIANGVPLDAPSAAAREKARAELGVPPGAVAIGYVGVLREIKGPDKLLQAFLDRFAGRPDEHLCLIGWGPMEADLHRAAQEHRNVHVTGLVINAARLLPGLDIYAQTSLSEGRSLSMLEAMAAGLPTVAHELGPVKEIHHQGYTALLVPVGDRAALGRALEELVADEEQRKKLGAAARERAQRHSIEPMVDAYAALYQELSS
jgi:glycosyltransferase involved in cell wall biosynthesis